MNGDDKDISICTVKNGKLSCNDVPAINGKAKIPAIPSKIGWLLVIVAFVLVVIAVVLNHLIMSIPSPVFTFPFFGGIDIDRWTLYDISLFLFVIAPCLVVIALIFSARKSRLVMVRD